MAQPRATQQPKSERAVLLPVGATEAHGYLPLQTDALIARAFCALAARPAAALVEDCLEQGFCPTTSALPGTKAPRLDAVLGHWRERLDRLMQRGDRYIVIVNVHGGNHAPLTAVVQDIYLERGFPLFYFNPYLAFASDLDRVHFAGRDGSFKECSLLQASLEMLGMPPAIGPQGDEDLNRDCLVEGLRKAGVVGFAYPLAAQHVAWRVNASAASGRAFLEETAQRFAPVFAQFRKYVERELAKKK